MNSGTPLLWWMHIWEVRRMLKVKDLNVKLGGLQILNGIGLDVGQEEIVALVGPNGAGKTTFINCVSGLVRATSGDILLEGKSISHLPPHKRVMIGLIQVPEGRRVFPDLTVLENLEMGGYLVRDEQVYNERVHMIFSFFRILEERQSQKAKTLSGGEQQMLAIGRSLMCQPRMLMLDEPSLGLAPALVKSIFEIVKRINAMGVTVLLVEQNIRQALTISNRAYVIENGVIVSYGNSKDIIKDPRIMKAYLGM